MFTYILNGKVLPERTVVSISNVVFKCKIPPLGDSVLELNISVQLSQLSIIIKSEKELQDYETLKNYVYDIVSLVVDVYGYLSGRGYCLEITSISDVENNNQYIFGVGIIDLEKEENKRPKTYGEIIKIFKGNIKFEQPLRLALSNFRLAIQNAVDTAFHSYRAMEAMARAFKYNKDDDLGKNDWDKFKTELSIEDDGWIMEMKKLHSDSQRHGNSTYMSGEDRLSMIKNTQKIIDKFVVYISK